MPNATSPLVNPENKNQRLTRKFLGNVNPTNTFDSSELKAYIKGAQRFRHGFYTNEIGQRVPAYHDVRQEYSYVDAKA